MKQQQGSPKKPRPLKKPSKFNSRQAVGYAGSPHRRELNNYLTPPKPDEMESDNEDRSGTSTNPRPHENKYKQVARQHTS